MRSACFRLIRKQAISYLGEALDVNQRERSPSVRDANIWVLSTLKNFKYILYTGNLQITWFQEVELGLSNLATKGKQQDSNEMHCN